MIYIFRKFMGIHCPKSTRSAKHGKQAKGKLAERNEISERGSKEIKEKVLDASKPIL